MKKAALIFGLLALFVAVSFGQTRSRSRTVDNLTLEKYKQQRLAAERDYRDNYERMGFPSPEELDRQRETDMAARLELAQQLRDARLERERLELERQSLNLEATRLDAEMQANQAATGFYGGYFGGLGYGGFGFGGFGRGRHGRFGGLPILTNWPRNRLTPFFDRGGYRVTPFGVIQTPRPQPTIVIRGGRTRRHR